MDNNVLVIFKTYDGMFAELRPRWFDVCHCYRVVYSYAQCIHRWPCSNVSVDANIITPKVSKQFSNLLLFFPFTFLAYYVCVSSICFSARFLPTSDVRLFSFDARESSVNCHVVCCNFLSGISDLLSIHTDYLCSQTLSIVVLTNATL